MKIGAKNTTRFFILFLFFMCTISCTKVKTYKKSQLVLPPFEKDVLISKGYLAAEYLSFNLKKMINTKKTTILITSFSDNDNLDTSNTLGRIIPYIISARLSQLGFNPVDIRLRDDSIKVKQREGEFILSRSPSILKKEQKADLVLTGHYSILYDKIYVHAEIVSTISNIVVSSYDFTLPLIPEMIVKITGPLTPSVLTN